jgi:hypothetical protein
MTALHPSIDDDDRAHPQPYKQRSRKNGKKAARFHGGKHDPTEQRHNDNRPKAADRKNGPFMLSVWQFAPLLTIEG